MAGDGQRLTVEADLDVTVEGATVGVEGYGDLLVVDAPSFGALRAFRRGVERLPPAVGPARAGGVTVDLRVRGVSVARIDPDADAGRLAAALGLAPARPSLGGLLRALLRVAR